MRDRLIASLWASMLAGWSWLTGPLAIVFWLSLVVGLLMVLLFGWTSDQKKIKVAKDQLKAYLLAVRLYQDQLPVVLRTYWRIIRGTGRYIRLAFMPLVYVIIPITILIVQADRYLGMKPIEASQAFLVKVQAKSADALNDVSLQLPAELQMSAPAVHIPAENEIVWRVVALRDGAYDIRVGSGGQTYAKSVVVSPGVKRLSPARLQDHAVDRMLISGEEALPQQGPIEAIWVTYAPREIRFAWIDWNWIVLFFVLSMAAGFAFKEILGIEI